MRTIADLHIHSYLSRATSANMVLEHIYKWAQLKGITVVGTGDFTHPKWFLELTEKLEPAEPGLFRLKPEFCREAEGEIPERCRSKVRFVLSVEISTIYKKGDRTRKVHNLILVPDLTTAAKFNRMLNEAGNIRSDGRPILGMDSKDLLRIALDANPETLFIPAHIWTPHFSVLGAASGFGSLEECFEEMTSHIYAIETGLSSNPPMNWRLGSLDRVAILSNSDAHSPDKLAREANVFDGDLSYPALAEALKKKESGKLLGTIEFFPEEGKYHLDGHRSCGRRMTPEETLKNKGLCPVCGRKAVVGVMHRVEALADRPEGFKPPFRPPYWSLIPLTEILGELLSVGPKSRKVVREYFSLLERLGNEIFILKECPLSALEGTGIPLLAEAIDRMRSGRVIVEAGYDGEYGVIRVFQKGEREKVQLSLF